MRLLPLVSAIVFVDALLFGVLTPLVPGIADDHGLSKTGAGLLVAAFGAGAILGGIPGGLLAMRLGPKPAVVAGLTVLAASTLLFAFGSTAAVLGVARFTQGLASTTTWAGALAWLTVSAPRERRGAVIGTAFAAAVLGAILGPLLGGVADVAGVRGTFIGVGAVTLCLAAVAAAAPGSRREERVPGSVRRALGDRGFLAGLWLNALPAFLFGVLAVLAPLALDDAGVAALSIGLVFLGAGLVEVTVNPLVGRWSDRAGRLAPTRAALAAAVAVSLGLAAASGPVAVAGLVVAAAVAYGGFYTPGMALTSDRSEAVGLPQALGFGVMNTAWAIGNTAGPALAGALGDAVGDALPAALGAVACGLTLAALERHARGGPAPA